MSKFKIDKVLILILVITFTFSPVFARKAQAQWIDIVQSAKELGLDAIGWTIPKLIVQRITASTVKWINTGFKGSPAYVTDPEAYFQDLGDKIAGQLIFQNSELNFLCGNMSAKIKLALARNYTQNMQWRCTLTQVGGNFDNFMNNFENGGWDSFFQLSQMQQNNPIGAYLQAENVMNQKIASKVQTKLDQLNQGNGFLTYQECYDVNPDGFVGPLQNTVPSDFVGPLQPGQTRLQEKCDDVTPGSVIAGRLNSALNTGNDSLVTADEINELVGALLNQLTTQVLSGLRGLSNPSPSSGNQTLTNQLSNSTAAGTTDYFGNRQDTSVLDVPLPGSTNSVQNQTASSYTLDQLMQSANTLTYNSGVTAAQMDAIHDSWVAKLEAGTVNNIASGSVLAYMLGWGSLPEGSVETTSGMTYQLISGTWVRQ